MSRLVVVSNRVPCPASGADTGGLAVAMKAALEESGGLWFGWSGEISEQPNPSVKFTSLGKVSLATVDLSTRDFQEYYQQFSNRTLWPLFHNRIDLTNFDSKSMGAYRDVNRAWANHLRPLLGSDDLVWVHDYHLISLGHCLRRKGVGVPLGFFLHIPFPPLETLLALPWHRDLIERFFAYDLIGFQTPRDFQNFRDYVEQEMGGIVTTDGKVKHGSNCLEAGVFPIGIDTHAIADLAASKDVQHTVERWSQRARSCMWIAGVDRLDYTKGLAEKFRGIEAFLEGSREYVGRTTLIQVAAPSRETVPEYMRYQAELEAVSGQINRRYATPDWAPIQCLNRSINHDRLAAIFRFSRVGLVTPLRDGMNLVAKEYVAAQDPEDPGVLVLSRFAGAADQLTGALLVNPYDASCIATALDSALAMSRIERQMRWRNMMDGLESHDVYHWRREFLSALSIAAKRGIAHEVVEAA